MFISNAVIWAAVASVASADLPVLRNDSAFESTTNQYAPTQDYQSCDLISPRFNVLRNRSSEYSTYAEENVTPVYTFLTLSSWMAPQKAGMIVDSNGTLIWHGKEFGEIRNLQVQTYNGQDYLTFFQIEEFTAGHASGTYYMLDSQYRIFKKFDAGNGFRGDLHEFKITKDNTALITVYEIIKTDLSSVTSIPFQNWIWDSLFQEIDLGTDEVLFEWRASDHYNFSDNYLMGPRLNGFSFTPWDWFHINSLDKDAEGNYLMSSRHLAHVACISGKTGNILWKLGGGPHLNDFIDLSDGKATDFQYQHHATWASDKEIVLFDNGFDAPFSRGLRIAVDLDSKKAKLVAEYVHPLKVKATTQGSYQVLPNGNVLIGWGPIAAYTEHQPSGAVVVDTHYVPSAMFDLEGINSYRTFQFPWVGRPQTQPNVAIVAGTKYGEDAICVSWNGATEVISWVFKLGESRTQSELHTKITIARDGFESRILVDDAAGNRFVQVSALDKDGNVLGSSDIVDRKREKSLVKQQVIRTYYPWKSIIYRVMLIVTALALLYQFRRYFLSALAIAYRSIDGRKAGRQLLLWK